MLKEHEIELRVRYPETDPMGLLHHANYFTYFEIGRTELLRADGRTYRSMEEAGQFVVVVKVSCRFRGPARYDDLLTLRTTVTRATAAKFEHEYKLFRNHELLAEAHVTMAVVDREGRLCRLPQWMRLDDD